MESPIRLFYRLINHKASSAFLVLLLSASTQAFSFPEGKQQLTSKVVNYVIKNQYDSAFSAISTFPVTDKDPLPSLLRLAVLGMRDVDFEQIIDSTRFLACYDSVSRELEAWEQQKGVSSYTRMLSGLCKAMHAAFYLRQKKYMSAMQNGFSALDHLKEAQELDSTNYEVDFFLGLYEYARAELRSRLWWVLFWYPGNRQKGIARVQRCAQQAILTGEAAKLSLCDMYIEEKRSKDAKIVVDVLREKYPDSRFVLWAEVKYFEAEKKYSEAARTYGRLATLYEVEQFGEFNTLTTRLKQATMLYESDDINTAKSICDKLLSDNKINNYRTIKKETSRLSEKCHEAAD
ncbi:MAG: hypothetical protein JW863_12600 [Chitinispirillaceae bacterium]|nr:hypothetical protein [Chitinispirillaceae bacterium]